MATRTIHSDRLKSTSEKLREEYRKLAELQAAEVNAKRQVWLGEMGPGVSQAAVDKATLINNVSLISNILKCKGEIAALEEERDHIRFCIKYNLEA